MKTKLFIAAALLLSTSAFAQNADKSKNEQGVKVSTVAKSETEAGTKGAVISGTASAKSQASLNRKNPSAEERQQRKAERAAAREIRKQEHKEFAETRKAEQEINNNPRSAEAKAEVEARKELMIEKKKQAKDSRDVAKADRKDVEKGLLNAEIKSKGKVQGNSKINRPAKVKAGVRAGKDIKVRRPKVGAKVQGSAGLGFGKL